MMAVCPGRLLAALRRPAAYERLENPWRRTRGDGKATSVSASTATLQCLFLQDAVFSSGRPARGNETPASGSAYGRRASGSRGVEVAIGWRPGGCAGLFVGP
jgi:hypothetical protein